MGLKVGCGAKVTDVKMWDGGKISVRLKVSQKLGENWNTTFDAYARLASKSAQNPPQKGDFIKIEAFSVDSYTSASGEQKYTFFLYEHSLIKSGASPVENKGVNINFVNAPQQQAKKDNNGGFPF